jgi:ABC-type antimicrobial peptide transport system permease subunit
VVGRGVLLAVAGGAAGLVMAVPLGRLLTRFLFQVDPAEPVALAGVLVAVAVVTAAAAWIPARRASSVDPVEALGAD